MSYERFCALVMIHADPPSTAGSVSSNCKTRHTAAVDRLVPPTRSVFRRFLRWFDADEYLWSNWRYAKLFASVVAKARIRDLWKLRRGAKQPTREAAVAAVRPVVWLDDNYPGFSGTCFLVNAFGLTFALTARHVLGGSGPTRAENMAVPESLDSPQMDPIKPQAVFWYNAGDYDHLADLAVALLGERGDGALTLPQIAFGSPEVGEEVFVVGFPKATSSVHYDLSMNRGAETLAMPDSTRIDHLFVWNARTIEARCRSDGSLTELGTIEFAHGVDHPDGMSGSPVFLVRDEKLIIAGILVRASRQVAHYVQAGPVAGILARNIAKHAGVVDRIHSVVEASLVGARPSRHDFPGTRVLQEVADFLHTAFDGNQALVNRTLQDWPTSGRSLSMLVAERAGDQLLSTRGDDATEMWRHIKTGPTPEKTSP